jgi:hypothetical protein
MFIEIGHDLCCQHDRSIEGDCNNQGDVNFGFREKYAKFRTILAYDCKDGGCDENTGGGCSRIQYFSNADMIK